MTDKLFTPYTLGAINLPNRIIMAPMTRNRADENGVPRPMMADHYAQRAAAGLLITECTQISERANGYMFTPGVYTDDQAPGVAGCHRCRSCKRRPYFQPDLAHRPGVPYPASTGWRGSCRPICRSGGHHGVYAQRVRTAHHAPRAGHR
jgi:hypothetical protein